MRTEVKILAAWGGLIVALGASLLLPHRAIQPMAFVDATIQVLLGVLAVLIAVHSSSKQRPVFINFALFFGSIVFLFASSFVGTTLFTGYKFSVVYYHTLVNKIALTLFLFHAILYAILDYLLERRSVIFKYVLSIAATACLAFLVFQPYLTNPMNLYREHQYLALDRIDAAAEVFKSANRREPTAPELLTAVQHMATEKDVAVTQEDIRDLAPYMKDGGDIAVFWKPIDLQTVYADTLVAVLIIAFLIKLYRSEKAFHSYADKMLIVFLVLCILNIIHTLGNIYATTLSSYLAIFQIGHIFTLIISLLLVYILDLKLRFVLSASGKYYEETLLASPAKVTRFRDEIDQLILKTFLVKDNFKGRFLVLGKPPGNPGSTSNNKQA